MTMCWLKLYCVTLPTRTKPDTTEEDYLLMQVTKLNPWKALSADVIIDARPQKGNGCNKNTYILKYLTKWNM
jgi:hypothetical protein